jgi:hypothetical protein
MGSFLSRRGRGLKGKQRLAHLVDIGSKRRGTGGTCVDLDGHPRSHRHNIRVACRAQQNRATGETGRLRVS